MDLVCLYAQKLQHRRRNMEVTLIIFETITESPFLSLKKDKILSLFQKKEKILSIRYFKHSPQIEKLKQLNVIFKFKHLKHS